MGKLGPGRIGNADGATRISRVKRVRAGWGRGMEGVGLGVGVGVDLRESMLSL